MNFVRRYLGFLLALVALSGGGVATYALTPAQQSVLFVGCAQSAKGADRLLCGEDQGLAIDTTDSVINPGLCSVTVRDTATVANNKRNAACDTFLADTTTTPKLRQVNDATAPYAWTPHNIQTYSEAFDNAAWTKSNVSVTANAATAPDGTATADLLTQTNTSGATLGASITTVAGFTYTARLRVKASVGTWVAFGFSDQSANAFSKYFNLQTGALGSTGDAGNGTLASASIVADAQGFWDIKIVGSFSGATVGNIARFDARVTVNDASLTTQNGDAAYAWGAQVFRGTVAIPYHATTAAPWYAVPIEYDGTSQFYGLTESAATNLALYASDLTNAAWTKSNMTTAKTATGPDGVANSATTLTATAGNATAKQAITSGSASRASSVFIKRRTGTGNIDVTQDDGTAWATQAVTATWTRFPIAAATAANPTVGIRIVTSGDAVDVWVFDHELTAVSSPIDTWAVAVTRAADAVNVALSTIPFSATAGTVYLKGKTPKAAAAAVLLSLDDGTANERFRITYTGTNINVVVTDGGVAQATLDLGAVAVDTAYQITFGWEANVFSASLNGAAVVTDTSGTLPTVTTLRYGYSPAGEQGISRFEKFAYVPHRVGDAQLPSWRFL